MKKNVLFMSIIAAASLLPGCGQGGTSDGEPQAEPASPTPYFEAPAEGRDTLRLCEAVLTTEEMYSKIFPYSMEDYTADTENTPVREAFYFPAEDIRDNDFTKAVALRWNYLSVLGRIMHSYELFHRLSSAVDEDDAVTRRDTLRWLGKAGTELSPQLIREAIPDKDAQEGALSLLASYRRFDGDDRDGAPFPLACESYYEAFGQLPHLVSEWEADYFRKELWTWYDKRAAVPQIDTLIRMNMTGSKAERPSGEMLGNLRLNIETEADIDRRTALALEYVKFDHLEGAVLLGEILESRIYTKYLPEAWLSWRTNLQMEHCPSSFGPIPNKYYDRLRVICIDTMVRHCLQEDDPMTRCLIDDLICREIIHRMGSLMGNSSFRTAYGLLNYDFIDPRLIKDN